MGLPPLQPGAPELSELICKWTEWMDSNPTFKDRLCSATGWKAEGTPARCGHQPFGI